MLNASNGPLPPLVIAEFEQTLMLTFLLANRHNYSHRLERAPHHCAPSQIRRAEAYIEANWKVAITLEDLAAASGVSAFSLFRSFKKSRGLSPMEFANQVRLRHAREMLLRPDATATVAEIAAACGFADARRFEKDYVLAFGEPPLQTLQRCMDPRAGLH